MGLSTQATLMEEDIKRIHKQWICSQFSAREKYAIPRALYANKQLSEMYTDFWITPGSYFERINKRAKGRYHAELASAPVKNFNFQMLQYKIREKITRKELPIDAMYDTLLSNELLKANAYNKDIFFGYSYASRKSMRVAKNMGLSTVLGQINPGPQEAVMVIEEYKKFKGGIYKPFVPDDAYWDLWQEEVSYSDTLIVNSNWAKQLLIKAGIAAEKCTIVPLAYERKEMTFTRQFKSKFHLQQPLQLLYLGGLELRKGFHYLIEAMQQLTALPVKLTVVGEVKGPKAMIENLPDNVTYYNRVAPHEVDSFYKNADLFLFPTLSDGFGLTQLEAQSYYLPIITTPFCAQVITHNTNGFILNEVNASAITDAVKMVLDQPDLLPQWSANAIPIAQYSLKKLSEDLSKI